MKNNLLLFFKGLFMGACDIVPGISGGTIALIVGIYQKLISSVNNLIDFFKELLFFCLGKSSKKSLRKYFRKIDWSFLISLFFGILTAIIFGSWLMSYLLNNFLVYTLSFFIGLILFSSFILIKHIDFVSKKFYLGILGGLVFGLLLSLISPLLISNPSILYILFSGFLAISAMFLPGISGSFILLILGVYDFMLLSIHSFNISIIIFFIIGAFLGLIFISRLINFLFKKYKSMTFSVLLGLVIGCLVIPLKRIFSSWSNQSLVLSIVFFILGLSIVYFVQRIN